MKKLNKKNCKEKERSYRVFFFLKARGAIELKKKKLEFALVVNEQSYGLFWLKLLTLLILLPHPLFKSLTLDSEVYLLDASKIEFKD
jgi:hypothetical protein